MEPEDRSQVEKLGDAGTRVVGEGKELVGEVADLARAEVVESGRLALGPALASLAGASLALTGLHLVLIAPIVPPEYRRLRGRVLGFAGAYLLGGVVATLIGGSFVGGVLKNAMPRTRRQIAETVEDLH